MPVLFLFARNEQSLGGERNYLVLLHAFMRSDYEMPDYSYGFKCSPFNWEEIRRYQYYLAMAREIQTIITGKGE